MSTETVDELKVLCGSRAAIDSGYCDQVFSDLTIQFCAELF